MNEGFEDLNDLEDEMPVIQLADDEGNEVDFVILDMVDYKGSSYVLCIEKELFENEEEEACIFKVTLQNDETEVYETIEDDEEFEAVAMLFQDSENDLDLEL